MLKFSIDVLSWFLSHLAFIPLCVNFYSFHFQFPTMSQHSQFWHHHIWPMIFLPGFLETISHQQNIHNHQCQTGGSCSISWLHASIRLINMLYMGSNNICLHYTSHVEYVWGAFYYFWNFCLPHLWSFNPNIQIWRDNLWKFKICSRFKTKKYHAFTVVATKPWTTYPSCNV